MILNRDFLCELRNAAIDYAQNDDLASPWKRAYLNLSDAANFLDAMIARMELFELTKDNQRSPTKDEG